MTILQSYQHQYNQLTKLKNLSIDKLVLMQKLERAIKNIISRSL
ncbi:hypothetical protein SAMN06313540_11220 [Epsilonproteobacteria bacterium SCGC AD-308-E02]|nr:hypothetical protein SAMN06313540_11220 [Epsilonproteobacteria bacterium SCGC AD-308-E02]